MRGVRTGRRLTGGSFARKGDGMPCRWFAVALVSLACLAPSAAQAQRIKLTPAEKAQLPKYCWGRHVDDRYAGLAEYNMPKSCGKFMNHMCPGFMYLIAAQRFTAPPRERRFHASKALGEFDYTKSHMPAECPLRQDLEIGMSMARMLQQTIR